MHYISVSFRWKFLRGNSERICHCVTKDIESPLIDMNNLIIKYLLRRYYLCSSSRTTHHCIIYKIALEYKKKIIYAVHLKIANVRRYSIGLPT